MGQARELAPCFFSPGFAFPIVLCRPSLAGVLGRAFPRGTRPAEAA
jgi:hypothetical protein